MKHLANLRLSIRSIGIIALALLLSLAVSPALAKPNCDGPNPPPSCSDPGDGDGTMTTPDVWAWWTGAVVEDAKVRNCRGSGNASNGGVSYQCEHQQNVWPVMVGGLGTDWTPDTEPLCSDLGQYGLVLDGENAEPVGDSRITTGYFFSLDPTLNDTACVAGADCLVRADIWAYFDDWCTSNGKKCGRLVIVQGWVHADPADDGDLNPFTDDQYLPVSDLAVTFKGIGTNKTVATCLYNSGPDTYFNTDSPLDPPADP